ncbi:MAG: hypothetical protein R3F59_03055 [Myxococcota bacterium]
MSYPSRALGIVALVTGWSLACGGGAADDAAPVDDAPVDVEEPGESPLLLERVYYFDDDKAGKPEWDISQVVTFHEDGTCRFGDIEITMDCTWESAQADGGWTARITGFTGAVGGDGAAMDPEGEPPGVFTVSADGTTLTEPDGKPFELLPEGEQGVGFHEPAAGGDDDDDAAGGGRGGKAGGGGRGGKGGKGGKGKHR